MKTRAIILTATVFLLSVVALKFFEKSEGEIFESIKVGEGEESVYDRLGKPSDTNVTDGYKDLRYWISYKEKGGYSLLGTSMGFPRIIRIENGIVVSKGRNEDYYDPHKPGWVPIKK